MGMVPHMCHIFIISFTTWTFVKTPEERKAEEILEMWRYRRCFNIRLIKNKGQMIKKTQKT